MSLLPKEHGAYGQVAMPLVTAIAVGNRQAAAWLFAVAVVAAFLAHEPLLVLIGRRGARARRDSGSRAMAWLTITGGAAALAAAASWYVMPDEARWSLLLPLVAAAILAVTIAAGQEKSTAGEVLVAIAFSVASIPVCLAGGTDPAVAVGVAAAFASIFVAATLSVRAIILGTRGGGQPGAQRVTRGSAMLVVMAAASALAGAWLAHRIPVAIPGAAAPGLAAALWLALVPPPPTRLRQIGWTLIATSSAAVVVLIVGLTLWR